MSTVTVTPVLLAWHNVGFRVPVDATLSTDVHNPDAVPNSPRTTQFSAAGGADALPPPPAGQLWKRLVRNATGAAFPGRVLAIMGPSGAGKTTFLNTISGRMLPSHQSVIEGVVSMNREVFDYRHHHLVSFVQQDDICMGKLTPREAIYFSRRMTGGVSAEEGTRDTDAMLSKLHIENCADTLIGIPGLLKGISGGEKKRTNIGCELVNNPRVVFLDEPTTGLDSVNALRVGLLLKEIATTDERTVVCTIHTPSSELYATFDDILLMALGRVVYHGEASAAPAFFASLGHPVPPRINPSEFFMDLLQYHPETIHTLADAFEAYRTATGGEQEGKKASAAATDSNEVVKAIAEGAVNVLDAAACTTAADAAPLSPGMVLLPPSKLTPAFGVPTLTLTTDDSGTFIRPPESDLSCVAQVGLLLVRSWRLTMRDPAGTIGRLVQTLFFSLFEGLFFYKVGAGDAGVQDRQGGIFFLTLNTFFMNVMPPLATFPPERAVFLNEMRKSMYSPVAYYIAKGIAELPFQLFFNTLFIAICYYMMGLEASAATFFTALGIILCYSYCCNAFGVFVASLFAKQEVAMAIVPMSILPMMLTGGLFANTARLEPYWIWLNNLSLVRFGFKAFMLNEFGAVKTEALCPSALTTTTTFVSSAPPTTTSLATTVLGNLSAAASNLTVSLGGAAQRPCRFVSGAEVIKFAGFEATTDTVEFMLMALLLYMLGLRCVGAFALWIQGRAQVAPIVFAGNFKTLTQKQNRPV